MASITLLLCGVLCFISWTEAGRVNVAFGQTATTTSSYRGGWPPSNAVDGDTDTGGQSATCFQSFFSPSDWTVDLQRKYQLFHMTVYMGAGNEDKTAESSVILDKDPNRVCHTFSSIITNNPSHLTCNESARYVTIKNPGTDNDKDSLYLCEVEIYACKDGTYGLDCDKICHCASCDRWTGFCTGNCQPGWQGKKCDKACSSANYGENCAWRCEERNCVSTSSSCDRFTGLCDSICLPGWQGGDCSQKCESSYYGANCSSTCSDRNCYGESLCDHVSGSCDHGCEEGWTGVACLEECTNETYGFNCNKTCADRNCIDNSISCDRTNGSCDTSCLPGWQGDDCTQECDDFMYGSNCSDSCSARNCEGNSSCHHVTGLCSEGCTAGWTGEDCLEECSNGTYGKNCNSSCENRMCIVLSLSCDRFTGSCDTYCLAGWQGADCGQECDVDHYGENCSQICQERHCMGETTCNHVTGSCDNGCEAGWMGAVCLQECGMDTYGHNCNKSCSDRNCLENMDLCDRSNGSCESGCLPGWSKVDCSAICKDGTYGENCTYMCSQRHCVDSSTCDHVTGSCNSECLSGWTGIDCRQECPDGRYGPNCYLSCADRKCVDKAPSCDRFNGSCDAGCMQGWKGKDCTQECNNGYYGIFCAQSCNNRHCLGDSPCNHVTGSCDHGCDRGWGGSDCRHACNGSMYGYNCKMTCGERKCNDMTSCDRFNGSCDTGCLPGWKNEDCTKECDYQFYGLNCSNRCAERHCAGTSTCNHVTGSCDLGCGSGWVGEDCTHVCNHLHYGVNCTSVCDVRHCERNSTCTHTTGECVGGCQAGWEGLDCTVCDREHYGTNCTKLCSSRHCEGVSSCSPSTGGCDRGCQTGWTGVDCTECASGHYRLDCSGVCADRHCVGNSSCNTTGHCDVGCVQGWTQPDCTEAVSSLMGESPGGVGVTVIVGAVVGAVFVSVVLFICIVTIVRKRAKKTGFKTVQSSLTKIQGNGTRKADNHTDTKHERELGPPEICVSVDPPIALVHHQHVTTPAHNADFNNTNKDEEINEENNDQGDKDEDLDPPGGDVVIEEQVRADNVIPVCHLQTKVREMEENPEIVLEEFKQIPDNFQHELYDPENQGKEVDEKIPFDFNRVVLRDMSEGDYINASFIDGYQSGKQYIISQIEQGTGYVTDFWRMIWSECCHVVVMVTRCTGEGEQDPCDRFWPVEGSSSFGSVLVTLETEVHLADFTITKLSVQRGKDTKKRHVTVYRFVNWPDNGVPSTTSLVTCMWRIRQTPGVENSSVLHCSTNLDHSGTFIALDSLFNQAMTEGVVDVVGFVTSMRGQRKNIINDFMYYRFLYWALVTAVLQGDTSLDADVITKLNCEDIGNITMGNETVDQHLRKFQTVVYDPDDPDLAITVPSYSNRCGFRILKPSSDVEKIWRRILDTNSESLVSWSAGEQSYIPSTESVIDTMKLTVQTRSCSSLSDNVYSLLDIHLKQEQDKPDKCIHHYHVTGSVRDPGVCVFIDSLVHLTGHNKSTVVMSSSLSEVRLLILLVNIASRLQDDGKVDVISDMRRVQERLGGDPFSLDDVRVCVEFAQRHLEYLGMYASL